MSREEAVEVASPNPAGPPYSMIPAPKPDPIANCQTDRPAEMVADRKDLMAPSTANSECNQRDPAFGLACLLSASSVAKTSPDPNFVSQLSNQDVPRSWDPTLVSRKPASQLEVELPTPYWRPSWAQVVVVDSQPIEET